MKKIITGMIIMIIYTCSVWIGSRYYYEKEMQNRLPEIKIVEKTRIEYVMKYAEYNRMNRKELIRDLKCYNETSPDLDGYIIGNQFIVKAGLCDRTWSRKFSMEVSRDSHFRYYIYGGLAVAAIVGGVYAYKKWKD